MMTHTDYQTAIGRPPRDSDAVIIVLGVIALLLPWT
jgi:hypothetical protein